MTSNPAKVEYGFTITSSDLARGQLNRSGTVRVDKVYTLSQAIVVTTFGRVNSSVLDQIRTMFQKLTAKNPS